MSVDLANETDQHPVAGGVGRVSRVIGPVVDVEFPVDDVPEMIATLRRGLDAAYDVALQRRRDAAG